MRAFRGAVAPGVCSALRCRQNGVPCAAVRVRGRRLRRRCFASDGTRMIMPAFGAYAGGLNVLDAAYDPLLPGLGFHAWMMGARTVVPVAAHRLESD